MLARSIFGTIGYGSLAYAVSNVPVVIWTLIINTAPFWTSIFGFLILGETVSCFEAACMVGAFSGVFILSMGKGQIQTERVLEHPWFGTFMALVNAVCYSMVAVMTRSLKKQHFSLVLLAYSMVATPSYILLRLFQWHSDPDSKAWPSIFYYDMIQWKYLAGISLMNAISLTCATMAFQKGKSSFITLIGLINVVYAFVSDTLIFKTEFTRYHVAGAAVITGCNVIAIFGKKESGPNK